MAGVRAAARGGGGVKKRLMAERIPADTLGLAGMA